jgi:hypothetical protein
MVGSGDPASPPSLQTADERLVQVHVHRTVCLWCHPQPQQLRLDQQERTSERSGMNVCSICVADASFEVNGAWYCTMHLHWGIRDAMSVIYHQALSKDRNLEDVLDACDQMLDDFGYPWPEDELEE